ncbi:MAG: putative alpha/beta-hydrolase family hydrolase [Candidatus Azotimanducaceae bacterium]|jgi:predicted alpha/beta-hydrolase family hydrolase
MTTFEYTSVQLDPGLEGCFYQPGPFTPILVLAHGAGAPFDHHHMTSIADALARNNIGTFRFNFPFMQAGSRRVDDVATSVSTIETALKEVNSLAPDSPVFLGGHSFGGRMATHLAATQPDIAKGLILFSFPLHVSKKPATKRAAHLGDIKSPMLFISGTRDTLAEASLMTEVFNGLTNANIHWLETADHGFKVLKRTRISDVDVYTEAADAASGWIKALGK